MFFPLISRASKRLRSEKSPEDELLRSGGTVSFRRKVLRVDLAAGKVERAELEQGFRRTCFAGKALPATHPVPGGAAGSQSPGA